jgi:hypothetical protein
MTASDEIDAFIAWAKETGWDAQMNTGETRLPDTISKRYRNIPEAYICFLSKVARMVSPKGAGWFNCGPEFSGRSDIPWRWNEWELDSYESTRGLKTERRPDLGRELRERLKKFWDSKLTIYMQVGRGDYEYYAIDMATGAIFYSHHEFWDEPEEVARSFLAFLDQMKNGTLEWFWG